MNTCSSLAAACAAACLLALPAPAFSQEGASPATRAANAAARAELPPEDGQDEAFATRGFLGTHDQPTITGANGRIVWDFRAYDGLAAEPPATVYPSLWRHARLLARHGLFQVSDRIYQVRGFDISNMSVLVGDTGYIIVDPLTTTETAAAAMALVRRHLGDKPVRAVIYSHSHADHFGGVRGVVSQADVDAGRVMILAPEGFLGHAVEENVIAGAAMGRRALFQFGAGLEAGPLGSMSSGIGRGVASGTISLIAPTREIKTTGEEVTIDGVTLRFQMTPGTEAPAEMNFHVPAWRALYMAENANASLHNILTPRGALVRDAKVWADGLTASIRLYGAQSDLVFMGHAWPRFGQAEVAMFLADHRDAYKFLHDQSVRLMNEGLVGAEIAERLRLPPALARRWYNRGYYGTLSHNSKAVYQRYLGWYEGNPARLNPLPPEEAGRAYVAAMGGPARVRRQAEAALARGEYRWAAQLLDHLIFADPTDQAAKRLMAQAHRQMAYQAESGIWRNMYLRAAAELEGAALAGGPDTASLDLIRATPTAAIFDLLAVRLDPAKADGVRLTAAFVFPDRGERVLATVRNGVLIHEHGVADAADVTVTLPRALFLQALLAGGGLPPVGVAVSGDRAVLTRFLGLFTAPPAGFAVVTP